MKRIFFCFCYQHRDSVGIVHCNSKLPDVIQGGVCDNAITIQGGQ